MFPWIDLPRRLRIQIEGGSSSSSREQKEAVITHVTSGKFHSIVLSDKGIAYSWGWEGSGALGSRYQQKGVEIEEGGCSNDESIGSRDYGPLVVRTTGGSCNYIVDVSGNTVHIYIILPRSC